MYNPTGYNMNPLPNVFDKEGQGRPSFVFFFGGYMNRKGCYDTNGNSDVTKALLQILEERYNVKYNTSDVNAITKAISEVPITPAEAILRSNRNIFPVIELTERLNQLDINLHSYDDVHVGDLVFRNGKVEFSLGSNMPIRDFPLQNNKAEGALEIFSMPKTDAEGKVFPDRYIIGHDPVDDDVSSSLSLTSTFVLDLWTDEIVAEWTGRLMFAEENFEVVRKLCMFYNCKVLYEAHPYSQIVRLPNGETKLWGDIKIGDKLFAPNGVVEVVDIPIDGEDDIYELTLEDGRKVRASSNHIWHLHKLNYPKQMFDLTTKQIFDKGCINRHGQHNFFIPEHKGVEYPKRELKIEPYTMGLIISEGSIRGSHCTLNNIQISSSYEDMEFYKTILPYETQHIGKKGYSWHLRIPNCKEIMKYYKLLGTDSHTKFIPNDYLVSSREDRLELLKGLMDGDGCSTNKGADIYITVSKQLMDDIMLLCRSLGIKCNQQISTYGYRIAISSEKELFKLPRKIAKKYKYKPNQKGSKAKAILHKTAIEDIQYIGKSKCKCVTVSNPDGLYLIGDYITTHNCNKKGLYAYFAKMNCTHLMADCPEYLKDKDLVKVQLSGNKLKGVNATAPINNYANTLIRDWLRKPITIIEKDENDKDIEVTVSNLYRLKNRALIKELINFNPQGNFDRIRALGMVMLYREEKMIMYGGDVRKAVRVEDKFFEDDFFKKYDRVLEVKVRFGF